MIFAEVESNVPTPSPEEVEAFYQANKSQITIPHDQAIPRVKQYMMDQARKHYRDAMVYMLKKQFPVKILLDPVRTEIATAGYPARGPDIGGSDDCGVLGFSVSFLRRPVSDAESHREELSR